MIVWLQLAVTIGSFTYVHLSCPICPLYFGSLTGKLSGTVLFPSRLLTSTAPVLDGIYMPYNYVGNVEQLLWRSTFMIILEWDAQATSLWSSLSQTWLFSLYSCMFSQGKWLKGSPTGSCGIFISFMAEKSAEMPTSLLHWELLYLSMPKMQQFDWAYDCYKKETLLWTRVNLLKFPLNKFSWEFLVLFIALYQLTE